ncbi:DNA-binding protein [Bradyrhizobium zhanjiangense]|uniref:DNA-binding protein n=1 Tax=Bradyrhizobium zhanjiangense TaxID=1325107 RepID=A0A4Q0QEN6_9BRAD|nr:DNA-binding protein [Bradyrhizobium zhanjiangense]
MNGTSERIKVEDVAQITGESKRTIQAAAARGEIPGPAKLFKAWTFDEVKLLT